MKKLPDITFHYDTSFDYGDRIDRLLKEAHAHDGSAQDGPAAKDGGEAEHPRARATDEVDDDGDGGGEQPDEVERREEMHGR